jgi:hypothetical protein
MKLIGYGLNGKNKTKSGYNNKLSSINEAPSLFESGIILETAPLKIKLKRRKKVVKYYMLCFHNYNKLKNNNNPPLVIII